MTRGDGLVFVCVALIFGMSFAPYFKASADGGGSGRSSRDDFGGSDTETTTVNAWAQDHWPLMAVVILLPLISFLLLVTHRYMVNADQRPVGGLTLRQWATSLGVVAAWAALWSLGGNVVGNADEAYEELGVELSHGFGAFVILPFTLIMALLLFVIDRVPGLAYPLFIAAPAYPAGYIPAQGQPGQPGQPGYGTGMYGQPVVPPGTPVAHMPPPMTGAMPVAAPAPAPAPVPSSGSGPGSAPGAAAAPAPAAEFAQFWLAVPEERPLLPVGGLDKTPVATLVPGSWYLAVEPAGDGLIVEVDGVRGVLWDTSGIQRGE
ncbi:hypothetical protein [Yinghuangia sp. YIM S09857]|uniref:hypothetical protein n=1 Tax=Yinghuangia sp. YIM S09857 TaxID=3436929 RepID=UPI003F53B16D